MRRVVASLTLLLMLGSCGENKTTGKPVLLHTELTTDLNAEHSFVTDYGWKVTLDKAAIATGPFYYYDGEPAFTAVHRTHLQELVEFFEPIHSAWAHPGHYIAGNAMGQMTEASSVDLLDGGIVTLPDGNGVTGPVRSATFSFSSPDAGPALDTLDGHTVVASGQAEFDGGTVYFVFNGEMADIEATAEAAQITGCTFDPTDFVADSGTVLVTVKPKIWFNLVDFSQVPAGTATAPTVIAPSSTAHIAFALGLGQLSAYEFSLKP
ncbi:MAG: hypothetical protein QM723_13040 [Myxococcaceae bacterium]